MKIELVRLCLRKPKRNISNALDLSRNTNKNKQKKLNKEKKFG